MHCADCRSTAIADTRLEGSDWLEMATWLLGGVPGWIYCAWRHHLRIKVCGVCGSQALMRESRAQALLQLPQAPPAAPGTRISNLSGPSRWPRALREPRQRLQNSWAWLLAWLLVAAGLHIPATIVAAVFFVREVKREVAWRSGPGRCRAWDAQGRPLQIEMA